MKNTIIVNLIGAPGTGKSTLMAEVFSHLKWNKIDCEMVTEFAKELIWEKRYDTFKDELYIFAKQNHRLFIVNGKVDIIITDRPLILTIPYNRTYGNKDNSLFNSSLENIVISTHNLYNNVNILLNRTKPYNPNGRNQSEAESDKLAIVFKNIVDEFGLDYTQMDADEKAVTKIIEIIKNNKK